MTTKQMLLSLFILGIIGNNLVATETQKSSTQPGSLLSNLDAKRKKKLINLIERKKYNYNELTCFKYDQQKEVLYRMGILRRDRSIRKFDDIYDEYLDDMLKEMDKDNVVLCRFCNGTEAIIYNTQDTSLCDAAEQCEFDTWMRRGCSL